MVGQTISHYRITEKLGEGGMGVVYKAEDTRLERPVALKFLAAHAIEDPEHKARFVREAKAAARLDHQNICPVYEIDEAEGQTFLAMAYLEGRTVKDEIAERPLKLDQALDVAVQTAQGLQAAHEKEIVHRDIKSANLMVTPQGQVKIMDFGLAQLAERSKLTETTAILGTPSYMSPEQAVGEKTDRRTDLWSLGVVLYEMVTGRLPFEAERQEAILFKISSDEPEPVTALRAGLPMELEWIIGKALAKNREERYQHAEDLFVDLRSLQKKLASGKSTLLRAGGATGPAVEPVSATHQRQVSDVTLVPKRRLRIYQAIAAVSAIAALVFVIFGSGEAPPAGPTRRFFFAPTEGVRSSLFNRDVAVSPNGQHIAFAGAGPAGKLWVQDLDQQQPRAIEGTEGAREPFWSPDSSLIGFATADELRKVPVQGGPAVRICPFPANSGGSWSPDGEVIVFASGNPPILYEVPASGGAARVLLSPADMGSPLGETAASTSFGHPLFLPPEAGPRVLVFSFGAVSAQTLFVQDLESGQRAALSAGTQPAYSPSGHLVYQAGYIKYELWALPFSLSDRKATGDPILLSENSRGPTVAADGTLVYLDHAPLMSRLVFVDRKGVPTEQIGQPMEVFDLTLSLDGRSVAFSAALDFNRDIWIHDLERNLRNRLTNTPAISYSPVWSADGSAITFSSDHLGRDYDIFRQRVDGTGEPEVLVGTPVREVAGDWSPDGRYLIYRRMDAKTRADLWYLVREGDDWTPHPFVQTPAIEMAPQFSPDGRYVAYLSDQSDRREVYVQSFPEGETISRISRNGGGRPRWNPNGKELFYVEGNTLMAVPVSMSPSFSPGEPIRLFDADALKMKMGGGFAPGYDVSPDGRQFIIARPVGDPPRPSIRVVQNWYEEFRDRE